MKNETLHECMERARAGDPEALAILFDGLQSELRGIVRRSRRLRDGMSIRTTEIFNDSFIKVFGAKIPDVADVEHLLAIWSNAVRWVVIEARRRKGARPDAKREDAEALHAVISQSCFTGTEPDTVSALFDELKAARPREGLAAELKLVGGLSSAEVASGLGVSEPTARRWVRAGRAWLQLRIAESHEGPA